MPHTASRKDLLKATIDRREFLAATATVAFGTLAPGVPSLAAEPSTLEVAGFKVRTFSDGHLTLPANMLAPKVDDATRAKALAAAGQQGSSIKSPLNVTLIEKGDEKILIDVGSGSHFMDTAGRLAENLEAAGVDPDSIAKVIYTHAHPDHVWGTVNDFDELSFPSATHYISEAEWNFWMAKDVLSKVPEERHGFVAGAQRNLKAAKSQLKTMKPGEELGAGIHVLDTAGHTPGHVSIEIGSGKETAVILGDALTHPVISFQHPDWQPAVDQEPDKAVATRKRLLDKLATDKQAIIGYHLPGGGLGRVERKGTSFVFAAGE